MEHRAAAAVAVGVDEFGNWRIQSRLPQCLDDETALPGAILGIRQMLHGAAAAYPKMRADRRHPLRAWSVDSDQTPPVGMAGNLFDLDGFAGQRAGHVDRTISAVGDAIAAMTEPGDQEPLNHARPR